MLKIDLRRLWQRFIRAGVAKAAPPTPMRPAQRAAPLLTPLPLTHQEAARSLIDREACNSALYLRKEFSASRERLDERMAQFAHKLCKELKLRGMPFLLIEGFRSNERQAELLKKGVTRAGPGQSPHNHGLAVDVVHLTKFWNLTNKQWAVIGLIGKEVARKMNLRVTWGGDWDFYDPAHWEIYDWRDET